MVDMDEMQTVRQWSQATGIPYHAILGAVKSGDLPSLRFKDRGQIFVAAEDIHQWVEDSKRRAIIEQ